MRTFIITILIKQSFYNKKIQWKQNMWLFLNLYRLYKQMKKSKILNWFFLNNCETWVLIQPELSVLCNIRIRKKV